MTKLYKRLGLKPGMTIEFEVPSKNTIVVKIPGSMPVAPVVVPVEQTVFERKKLKHIHIEPFRPENLRHWEPETETETETETDVYLAFGVLQEYTDYRYCCGASKSLLTKLGAYDESSSKPDAILIDQATDQYLMAEWKMKSSQFSANHHRDDIDVLVCWHDDEADRSKLPNRVVSVLEVAREAAAESLSDDAG